MATPWGTLVLSDTLAYTYPNIRDYGEGRMADDIARLLAAYNNVVRDELDTLADITTERIMGYAGNVQGTMTRVDEFGRAAPQKTVVSGNLGFPLWMEQFTLQWTRKWMENHTPMEMLEQVQGAQIADALALQSSLRTALFTPTNYTFLDKLVDNYSLGVKALANADGAPIPAGPNGESFNGATHTHYLVCATPGTLAAADMTALITTVAEHYNVGKVYVYANAAQETTIRGLTGFTPLNPVQIIPATTAAAATGNLDTQQLYDRQIGFFGNQAAEVWIKPWIPSGYLHAFIVGQQTKKVLAIRERRAGSLALTIAADNEQFPLRAQTMEREYGIGVQNRIGGAVLDITNGSYTTPAGI
jgi:hypothetical protein